MKDARWTTNVHGWKNLQQMSRIMSNFPNVTKASGRQCKKRSALKTLLLEILQQSYDILYMLALWHFILGLQNSP